jgi:spermidine synthase
MTAAAATGAASSPAQARVLRPAAFVAFFLSGASSLVFQTLWSRLLSHVFGSSSLAVSSVVSVFMAGLGIGAYWFGRRADRIRDPLLLDAAAEFLVGCAALVVPWLVRSDGWLASVNAALRASLGAGSFTFVLARFACIVPILIVPTVLMGSTLPLLARHFVSQSSSPDLASREVGRLYAVNTFGAVVGVVTCTFVLLPKFGVGFANAAAASTNFALAALIVALRRASGPQRAAADAPSGGEAASLTAAAAGGDAQLAEVGQPQVLRRAAALAFACSGFASLLYEVVWSRALVNTIGGSLYSFALILTTFLVGIAGGSALGSALADRARPALPIAAIASAFLCVLAAGPLGVHAGRVAFAGTVLVGWSLVGVIAWFGRITAERDVLFEEEPQPAAASARDRRPALVALVVPILVAGASVLQHPQRLSFITLAVVGCTAVLLGILVAMQRAVFGLLVALQLYVAGATLVSDAFADSLSLTFAGMVAPLYRELPEHVATVQGMMFVTAALCVLPSALGMGAVFPATLRVWTHGGRTIGRDVGVVYTGNTVGSILGAWLPGFVLMPAFGMQASLHIGVGLNLAIALGLASVGLVAGAAQSGDAIEPRRRRSLLLAAAVVPWALAALAFVTLRPSHGFAWNISKMTLGAFRISLARDVLDEESWGAPELVYYRDGLSTTVTVERWGRHFSLKNNGKVDASNGDDMPTQIMVAALPLLFHPRGATDRDVAVVGFGSGVTVGAALQFPVRSVEVVELERSTIEASRFFADVNHLDYAYPSFPYVREPRLRVIADDGRNYLAASRKKYDVIVSEPSNPWLTGVSDLFTLDHFRIAKQKLAPGGIYCQWVQLYELSPENVKIIYRTFSELFRYVIVFSAEDLSSDTVMLGSDSPLPLDLERVSRGFALPRVAAELERAYIHSPEDVLARVLMSSKQEVVQFSQRAPLNTDDNARIELAAPRDLIGFERYKGYLETMYAPDWPYGRVRPHLTGFGSGARAAEHYAALSFALLAHGRKREVPELLALGAGERAKDVPAAEGGRDELAVVGAIHHLLATTEDEPALGHPESLAPDDAPPEVRGLVDETVELARTELAASRSATALAKLERIPSHLRRKLGSAFRLFESYVQYKAGDAEACIDGLEHLLRDDEGLARRYPATHYFLARAHDGLSHFDKGVRNMRVYVLANSP